VDVEQDLHRGWPPRAAGGDPCSPVDRRQQRSQPPRLLAVGDHVTDPAGTMEIVRPSVPVNLDAAVLAESWSNDTWLAGESVLRVRWRGDRERLVRERRCCWDRYQPRSRMPPSWPRGAPGTTARPSPPSTGPHSGSWPHSAPHQQAPDACTFACAFTTRTGCATFSLLRASLLMVVTEAVLRRYLMTWIRLRGCARYAGGLPRRWKRPPKSSRNA